MNFLFVLAGILTGFFAGIFYGIATVPKGSGLAGPAIVLMDGAIGAVILLAIALWARKKLSRDMRKKITVGLLLACLLPIGWMIYRFETNRSQEDPVEAIDRKPVTPVIHMQASVGSLGIGVIRPDFFNKQVMYFYSPNLQKSPNDHTPVDSLSFGQTDHHQYDITYAPPWFFPEAMKMDYEILYMKVLNRTHDWIQVEVNKQTGQSSWISASEADIVYWPDFLLSVNSVENLNPTKNSLRVKPLSNASLWVGNNFQYMRPIMINEHWMQVSLLDNMLKEVGKAWLLWHDGKGLLVSYNILS
ncbi:MAG: hypothetical protein RLN86_11575 [Cyclobacteriaceae bacterium]